MYRGPFFGVIESQARWVAALFSQNVPYPDAGAFKSDLDYELSLRNKAPRPQFPRGNYGNFMYELAREMTADPIDVLQAERDNPDIPMVPADFRCSAFNAKPAIATNQRERLL